MRTGSRRVVAMLSPKTQTNLANAKGYFEEHLCAGDYYAEDDRVQGVWMGKGAARLGLNGVVTRDAFLALCDNQHPVSGKRLTQRKNTSRGDPTGDGESANRRVFFDFTISPPKSVSIAALVAYDTRIVAAHREAIRVAVGELEQFASARLRTAAANSDRRTGNIVAALFEHETSRALDPHLHTHCIVFNATHDDNEGRWKALQNYDMLAAQKYVENVYYHELARALRGMGYTIVNAARGDFELAEVSEPLRVRFSKRHQQIDEQTQALLAAHPELESANLGEIREHLAHKERDRKVRGISPSRLLDHWTGQLTDDEREAVRMPLPDDAAPQDGKTAVEAVSWAEEHLFERRSVVREHELWRHALVAARGDVMTLAELKQETKTRGYLRADKDKISPRDVLAREWAIVEAARDGVGRHSPLVAGEWAQDGDLAPDQLRALHQILRSTDFITLFRGGAGTGKSFVLRRVQGTLRRAGRITRVAAPQRQQVIDLGRDGLTDEQTVAELLQQRSLPEGAVVIVDEAGQIGGRQMLALLQLVHAVNGRIILSGDTRQHGPVEASDALRAIERYAGLRPAELKQIRRQDPARAATEEKRRQVRAYREAVEAAADGEAALSLHRLKAMGAVRECGIGEQREKLVEAYLRVAALGESAIIVSQTGAEVREVNDAVRDRLRTLGILSGAENNVTALESVDLTAAQKADARFYPADGVAVFNRAVRGCERGAQGKIIAVTASSIAVEVEGRVRRIPRAHLDRITLCRPVPLALCAGDILQLKTNGTAVGGSKLANGEIVTVAAILPNGAVRLTDGRQVPASYRQFQRGYAVTSYGSQGKTVDHVFFADAAVRAATNAQQWYVTISRGRKGIQIFTADKEALRQHIARTGDRELALDLAGYLPRQRLAREQLLRGVKRGREFARRVCHAAMRAWSVATFSNRPPHPHHETPLGNPQTNKPKRANLLAT